MGIKNVVGTGWVVLDGGTERVGERPDVASRLVVGRYQVTNTGVILRTLSTI